MDQINITYFYGWGLPLKYSASNFSLTDIFNEFSSHFSQIKIENLRNTEQTWDSLIEAITFYTHWEVEKQKVGMNTESWLTENLKESLIIKASSNIETALRDCSISRLSLEFPKFEDIEDLIKKSTERNHVYGSHEKIQKIWVESLKNYIPYGANPSFRQIKEYLSYISKKCSEDFALTLKNSSMEKSFIDKMVGIRNSIAHGNKDFIISDKLLAILIWHSFEITRMLNFYATGIDNLSNVNSGSFTLSLDPFDATFINFEKTALFIS